MIYVTIPEPTRKFLWFTLPKKSKRKALSVTFEKVFEEQIQIGSILPVNVWGRGVLCASVITMSPMILKIEGEERIQHVTTRVGIKAENRYNIEIPDTWLARTDLEGAITNIVTEQGFSKVGGVVESDCEYWDESNRLNPFTSC